MEPVSFKGFVLNDEQQKKKEEKVKELLRNPYIIEWLKNNNQTSDMIYQHSGKFGDYAKMMEKCENCQGLNFCRQDSKGFRFELYLEGQLMHRLNKCQYNREKQQQMQHSVRYRERDFSDSDLLIDITRLDLEKESIEYKLVVSKIMAMLLNEEDKKGLYLWGKPGVGKSYLAAGICNYYAKKGCYVAFVNVPKLISDLKRMFQDNEAMERKLTRIAQAEVLVLDDIGGESVTAWSRDDILLPLLDVRMQMHKRTIFTSNYSFETLKERLSMSGYKTSEPMAAERLLERIKAISKEIFVKGETRRK